MAEEVSIPIDENGEIPLVCDANGGAIIALCGCGSCCPTGNECLHDFLPFGGFTAGGITPVAGDGQPVQPRDILRVNNQPEGFQIIGRRFDLLIDGHSSTGNGRIDGNGALLETLRTTTINPRRERYRTAPFGLSDEDFAARFVNHPDHPDDPDDLGGGAGWKRAGPIVIDHASDNGGSLPTLELWINPDPIITDTTLIVRLDGEVLTDTTDQSILDDPPPSGQIVLQNNALGSVNPTRCDGLYWQRPAPAAMAMLLDGWFDELGDWGTVTSPENPIFTRHPVLVDDDGLPGTSPHYDWQYTQSATLAGWDFLARGGSFDTGVVAYRFEDLDQQLPVSWLIPQARCVMSSDNDYGELDDVEGRSRCRSSMRFLSEYHNATNDPGTSNYTGYAEADADWSSEMVVVEECAAEMNLPPLDCPDPDTLPRAAIACDVIAAPVDVVGFNPDDRPPNGVTLLVTYPLGSQPGDLGSTTWRYLPTNHPTLRPTIVVPNEGQWSDQPCDQVFAVYGLCGDPLVTILVNESNKPPSALSAMVDDEKYAPLGLTAPGIPTVIQWSDEPCPAHAEGLWERCHGVGSGDLAGPDRVRTSNDLAGVDFMQRISRTPRPTAGYPDCHILRVVHFHRLDPDMDDGGDYLIVVGWPKDGPCEALIDLEREEGCGTPGPVDPPVIGPNAPQNNPAVLAPPTPSENNMEERYRQQVAKSMCFGCGDGLDGL